MIDHELKSAGCAMILAVTLAMSGTAWSQPPPEGGGSAQQATEHFLKGKALMEAGNTRGAYEEYRTSWGLKKTYDTAANLGNIELQLGKPRDAAEHMAYALQTYAVTGTTREKLERMRKVFEQARAQVGTVKVMVNVDGAEVSLDGRPIGRSPLAQDVFVEPGSHVLMVTLAGYQDGRAIVAAGEGSSHDVTLTLVARGPSTPLIIAGSAVTGVAIVTGAVLLGVSAAKGSSASALQDSLEKHGGCSTTSAGGDCAELRSLASARATLGNAGLWTLVGAGVIGVATLVYGVAGNTRAPAAKSSWRLLPAAAGDGGGLMMTGTF